VRSDLVCDGGLRRTSTGVISMTSVSEWMDVQSVAVGEQKAVRVLRYREASASAAVPAEITTALGSRPFSISAARLAATAPVSPADIVDVSRNLDAAGAEVWLLEQRLAFTADAKRIVDLTDAGVPGSVVDVVVALSYPERFAIDLNRREIETRPGEPNLGGSSMRPGYGVYGGGWDPMWDPYYGSRYGRRYYSPYGYSQYGYGYGYGGGYGWYPGQRPVVIVVTPPVTEARREGRAVKGRGYTRTRPDDAGPTPDRRSGSGSSSGGSASSGGSSGGSSSGGASSGGSSSGGSTGRTAKPKPPGN
jgi:hypothetical protein